MKTLSPSVVVWMAAAILYAQAVFGQASPVVQKQQDGISASLSIKPQEALLSWRFVGFPPSPLTDIIGSINGRPLDIQLIPYPQSDSRSFLLLLLDVSDPNRSDQINLEKAILQKMAENSKPHDTIAIATYSNGYRPLELADNKALTLSWALAAASAQAVSVNLGQVLESTVGVLGSIPASRRAIYVLTDGHSDDNMSALALGDRARPTEIIIYFILVPSERSVDLGNLSSIASATGGLVISSDQLNDFLKDPFYLVDSGGSARLEFNRARRYFWERNSNLEVGLHYGDRTLDLSFPAKVPTAGIGETISYLFSNHATGMLSSLGIIVAAIGVGGIALLRHKRKAIPRRVGNLADSKGRQVLAVLQDVKSGTVYPIQTTVVHIGRAATNEVVVEDETVSRLHAVLEKSDEGGFLIENKSKVNSILVNGQDIKNSRLTDGDVISLGSTTLRFARVPGS